MTIFRYKNGLLYTITKNCGRCGSSYKAHPYNHHVEIGVVFDSHARYRDFKSSMSMEDFKVVSVC